MSDEAGNSSGVEVILSIDDVVACGDDPLLSDAVRVGGWLWSHRGVTEVVVGPGVVQPGWADGLICADGSLRPEPPQMHAMYLICMFLAAAC